MNTDAADEVGTGGGTSGTGRNTVNGELAASDADALLKYADDDDEASAEPVYAPVICVIDDDVANMFTWFVLTLVEDDVDCWLDGWDCGRPCDDGNDERARGVNVAGTSFFFASNILRNGC